MKKPHSLFRYILLPKYFPLFRYTYLPLLRHLLLPKYLFFLLSLSFCFMNTTLAETNTYNIEHNKRINITVAENGLNRISVGDDRILKVVGDGELYSLEGDPLHGFVFFKSKVSAPKTIPITILTEKNKVLDVNVFIEVLQEPKTVVLKYKRGIPSKTNSRKISNINYERLTVEAITDIKNGNTDNFTITDADNIYPNAISAQVFWGKYIRVRKIDFTDRANVRNLNLSGEKVLATTRYDNTILIVESL